MGVLYKEIKNIIEQRGTDYVCSLGFVSLLDDYRAFKEIEDKPLKSVLRNFIKEDMMPKFLELGVWDENAVFFIENYAKNKSLNETDLRYLFHCIAYGLNWTTSIPERVNVAIDDDSNKSISSAILNKCKQRIETSPPIIRTIMVPTPLIDRKINIETHFDNHYLQVDIQVNMAKIPDFARKKSDIYVPTIPMHKIELSPRKDWWDKLQIANKKLNEYINEKISLLWKK